MAADLLFNHWDLEVVPDCLVGTHSKRKLPELSWKGAISIATLCRLDGGKRCFCTPLYLDQLYTQSILLCNENNGLLPLGYSRRNMKMTMHIRPVPSSRIAELHITVIYSYGIKIIK
jgi:hypothetical protein